jgi:hypothetical protein
LDERIIAQTFGGILIHPFLFNTRIAFMEIVIDENKILEMLDRRPGFLGSPELRTAVLERRHRPDPG